MSERSGICRICRTAIHEYPYGWDHVNGPGYYPPNVLEHEPEPIEEENA